LLHLRSGRLPSSAAAFYGPHGSSRGGEISASQWARIRDVDVTLSWAMFAREYLDEDITYTGGLEAVGIEVDTGVLKKLEQELTRTSASKASIPVESKVVRSKGKSKAKPKREQGRPAVPVKLEALSPAETKMPTTSGKPGPKEQKEWKPIVSHLQALYRSGKIANPNDAFHEVNGWRVDNKKAPWARSTVIDGIKRHWSEITKIDD
jgi:hypothetical protein